MRIIAGERRGHKIDGPKGTATRPTSDLVRESLFNILREAVDGRVVIDLFAGTGAIGMEALSRGAARAVFVERSRENVTLIHRNLERLRYEDRGRVQLGDAYRWARTFTPDGDEPLVVLLDPPYRDYEVNARKVKALLVDLVEKLPPGSVVAVESGLSLDDKVLPEIDAWDVRRYGGTQVAFRSVPGGDGPAEFDADAGVEPALPEDQDDGPNDVDA